MCVFDLSPLNGHTNKNRIDWGWREVPGGWGGGGRGGRGCILYPLVFAPHSLRVDTGEVYDIGVRDTGVYDAVGCGGVIRHRPIRHQPIRHQPTTTVEHFL